MNTPLRLIIADDHPVVRSGLRTVLERAPGIQILYDTGNGEVALQLIRQSKPDVAILDIEMPVMDGFAVARAVQEEELAVDIIFMTMHNDELTFNKAMDAGIKGFVLKENAVTDILDAVTAVTGGRYYLSPRLSDYLVRRGEVKGARPGSEQTTEILTPAEKRILALIAEQKTSKTIAGELFISLRTVEKHRSNICMKLNLRGAFALLKFAIESKGRL